MFQAMPEGKEKASRIKKVNFEIGNLAAHRISDFMVLILFMFSRLSLKRIMELCQTFF
jgi:hypothetical protein